ncbi:methyl-accepting chemotaxis protein [Christensenellaceae bacterium OttesenSCG-928-K19]|nr:methyl-accepting chemotaxis protein [Christensenellaceae bacterium OttesenSCG-928-K19]
MKNMPVGKKILTGFMIVILMIGVILAMTVITSLSRNNDLSRVDKMSTMQASANEMLNNFNLARVEIRTVFTSIDAESEYNIALEYLDKCTGILEEMKTMSAGLDGYGEQDILALEEMFANVRAGVVNVGDNDELAIAALTTMTDNGLLMAEKSSELFDQVVATTQSAGTDATTTGGDRITRVVVPAKALGDTVDSTRLLARNLLLNQDLTVIPDIYAGLDSIEAQATSVRSAVTTDTARQAVDELTQAVSGFRSSVEEVDRIMTNSEAEIAVARDIFLELNDLVFNFVLTISAEVASLNDSVISTSMFIMFVMIGVAAAAVVVAFLIATYIGRIITHPLNKMKEVMLQAGTSGNLNFPDDIKTSIREEAQKKDEIGQSLRAFTVLIDHITNIADKLEKVAGKDLSVDVDLLSEEDTMGLSLKSMLESLNYMFSEINMIAAQVSTAAGEVSMGAQGLAQGSTEQAATVEEISASMNEINDQMKASNESVTVAAQESESISQMAMNGNEKMSSMVNSMQEITEASQAIERVIKVIDDIAFQTNILALNAAVEAARAGSAGQGFAVVADEVRNLAAKSAEAAKETAELISANIEKTQLGLATTQETADSLVKIMEGIESNRNSLQTVSQQSANARAATGEVNTAVEQVAQVVQQNSATSEESAAASQQMSSQAHGLQELVSQFKLKNQSGRKTTAGPETSGPVFQDDWEEDSTNGYADESKPEGKY